MPVINMSELRTTTQERKKKKELLEKQLRDSIKKDIANELTQLSEVINLLETLCDDGNVVNSDPRIYQNVIPTLRNSFQNFEKTFNKNDPYYNDRHVQEFRKLILNSIAQKNYSNLIERIKNI